MQPGLFRPRALSRLSSPEQLDQAMRVTSARGWLAFLGLGAVIVAALIWGFVGTIPTTVNGQSVLLHEGGPEPILATMTGQIVSVAVRPDEGVTRGQVIARVRGLSTGGGPGTAIVSPETGRIDQVLTAPGRLVRAVDTVATIERPNQKLDSYAYVPIGPGKQIKPGMSVQVSPSSVDPAQYGYLIGRVQSVSDFPATEQDLSLLLNNDQLTKLLLSNGPVLQIVVNLERDRGTASGYKWSSPKGPPFQLTHGTLATVKVVIGEQRPIHLVLPGA
jgi:HlyD family secretion protein